MSDSELLRTAYTYLQQRGYRAAHTQLVEDKGDPGPGEVKLNEMVSRDAQRKAVHCTLQLPFVPSASYDTSYTELVGWMRTRPLEQQKEINEIRYHMFIHCFLLLAAQQPVDAQRFLRVHAPP